MKLVKSLALVAALAVSSLFVAPKPADAFFLAGPGMAYAISGLMGVALATDGHNQDKQFVDGAALASGRMDVMTTDKSKQAVGYNDWIKSKK
jgi:hypothetical protein